MRAVLYARVSSDDRGNDGRNLAGQLDMCREYAQRHGWQIVAELAEDDRGASGASFDLPQLNKALELAASGAYDILVTREIDRFARKLAKQLIVEEELKRSGVQVEYVLGDYPDTPEGGLMKNVRAVIAEYERLKINERMTRGRLQSVRAGNVMIAGPAPFGYRKVERDGVTTLEINEDEAAVVRLIFQLYTEEGLSTNQVVKRLNELAIPTPTDRRNHAARAIRKKGPGRWARSTIYVILRAETYTGIWYYNKADGAGNEKPREEWIGVAVPAIIDRETWERAEKKRRHNKSFASRPLKHDYLLRGRVTCGHCGAAVHLQVTRVRGNTYRYYRCDARSRPRDYDHSCDLPYYSADEIDAAVWHWVRAFVESPEVLEEGAAAMQAEQEAAAAPLRARIALIDDLLAQERTRLELLLDLYLSGDMARDMLVDRKHRLEQAIAALEAERAEKEAELGAQLLTAEQVEGLKQLAARLALGLDEAEANDLELQQFILEQLNLTAKVLEGDGEWNVKVDCDFSPEVLLSPSTATRCYGNHSRLPGPAARSAGFPRPARARQAGWCGRARRAPPGSAGAARQPLREE